MLAGPAPHGCGDEFRPVIGPKHLGCPMCQDSQVKHFDHIDGSHAPLNAESQVLARELIDEVTDLEHAPLPVRIELEINGPHLPRSTSPDQGLQAWCGAGLVGFARTHAKPLGAPQAPERITPYDNALTLGPRPGGGVWVFRTVCFERVVLSSPGCLWPGRMDDHEEVLEAHA